MKHSILKLFWRSGIQLVFIRQTKLRSLVVALCGLRVRLMSANELCPCVIFCANELTTILTIPVQYCGGRGIGQRRMGGSIVHGSP